MSRVILSRANLGGANLSEANLSEANLIEANLGGANLSGANINKANLGGATLTGCNIYGISAWGLIMNNKTEQKDLIITPSDETEITVDNIEVAQFIYLLLYNEKIRDMIGTVAKKAVLILGRFTLERKVVLDAIKQELRTYGYLPILFDFEKSKDLNTIETVSLLAHMSRFIIADISNPKSISAELEHIVPHLPSVPVIPIILKSDYNYDSFENIIMYNWVLEPYRYKDQKTLLKSITNKVIKPAEKKRDELKKKLEKARNAQ